MSTLPSYIHIVKPNLKHIYLSFNEKGELIIKSPKISTKEIEKILLKKSSWINNSRKKFNEKKGKSIDFSSKRELYFLGKSYPILLIPYEKKRTKLNFDGNTFTLYYSIYDEKVFQYHIDTFYKEEAKQYIHKIVDTWTEVMGLAYNNISFRKTKCQWGSCSSRNNLSFNTMIMKLPLNIITYIIIHELAHITHKHHQKSFWELIEKYLPNYREYVSELKTYSPI